MSTKISLTGLSARTKAIKGMSYVADRVKASIGPFGENHLSEKSNTISNDGAFIAEHLAPTIKDEFEKRGALVVQQNVAKINDIVGDGSSTAWALHDDIIKEIIRYLPNDKSIKAKKTYSEVAKMLNKAKDEVIKELGAMATPITSKEELIKSALVSVEDEAVAELLGTLQWELGPEGRIIAEEVNDTKSSVEKVNGIMLDNGFGATHLVTNPEKQSLEVNDMQCILTNYTIGVEEIDLLKENIFKQLIAQKKIGVILIARAFTADAIKRCQESSQARFVIFPINAPYTDQREIMRDIETVTGGRYIDTEENSLEDIYITDVGFIKRLEATMFKAIVTGIEDENSKARVAKRVELLKKKLIGEQSDFMKRALEERIAQLTNGFGILKVGSLSLTDRQRLKDKCDDAVNAVRLALKGGTVKGAGLALKEISDKMEEGNILKRPLLGVYNQIISSAPEDFKIEDWVRDPVILLQTIIEKTCAFCPTFASIGSIDTSPNPEKCHCNIKNE
ncbi:MAG: TCP-1/cpn60 chaperonin family protein [Candidatus Roizmanbacteria bacterium]